MILSFKLLVYLPRLEFSRLLRIKLSFQNKTNDTKTVEFLDTLKHIYSLINCHYEIQGTIL